MALETKPRHPRDTRPFGTADHRVDNANGDTELVRILDWLADEQWISGAPILIGIDEDGSCMWKIASWRSHSLRYEPDPAIVKEENRERRENRSRHQEAAALLSLEGNNDESAKE
jgi:hypothetical protein